MKRLLSAVTLPLALGLAGCGSSNSAPTPAPVSSPSASLSTSSFDFGDNLVGNTVTDPVVTVTNTGTTAVTLHPALSGDPGYAVASGGTCGASLAVSASCTLNVSYTPTSVSGTSPQTATLTLGLGGVSANTPQTVALTGSSGAVTAGTVAPTRNSQVALYTLNLPFPGSVTVSFGTDTTYGRNTSAQTTATAGPVSLLVAGMLANTPYHLRATVHFNNGLTLNDADHTFTTGAPVFAPSVAVDTPAGLTPQPGVEELTLVSGATIGIAVTDLAGKPLWGYTVPTGQGYDVEGVRLLPNGHFLLSLGEGSSTPLSVATPIPGAVVAIREIDLAGNIVREITASDLNPEMQAAGFNVTLREFHHDITPLANGHWLVLANTLKAFTDLPGYPGVTNVLGDVIIDLDPNLQPVWFWNSFDHLDVNRHPMMFPDWTHSNAVVYSPTDGNLFLSMRHQNWVLKIDYNNGAGSGNILWHLGQGGDFTLGNGVDPTDWFYAQHYPFLFTAASAGVFSLGLMDNGNDRAFPTGTVCNFPGAPSCLYSTASVLQLDESARTAALTFHQVLPPNLYSFFGGNIELLANGNIEYDLAGTSNTTSDIFEVTPTASAQTVWHMRVSGGNAYRGFRLPSLYPGVQW